MKTEKSVKEIMPGLLKRLKRKAIVVEEPIACGCGREAPPDYAIWKGKYTCSRCRRKRIAEGDIRKALRRAGVPDDYLEASFDTFQCFKDLQEHFSACIRYADGPSGTIFLYGDNDHGKSHLGIAILRDLCLQGFSVAYCHVPRLFREISQSYDSKTARKERWFIERYGRAEFLLLDDIGAEYMTPFKESLLYQILDEQVTKAETRMAVTSNFDLEQIEKSYSGRISTRIARKMVEQVEFRGKRYRLR